VVESRPERYEIQGRSVTIPVEVRDASGAVASFLVKSSRAQRQVGDAFEVVDFLPGRTLLLLGCIDYKDNDLGDYNEVAINFFVRERGASSGIPYLGAWRGMANGSLSSYAWKMPVNQSFTCEAGSSIWGFPKTVERIEFDYSKEGSFGALLEMGGKKVFELRTPRGGSGDRPPMNLSGYSYINGIPHRTDFTSQSQGLGVKFGGGDFEIELGNHRIAEALREMGLPKRPLMTMWTEKMVMQFQAAEKL
jgi:hypothetical protein